MTIDSYIREQRTAPDFPEATWVKLCGYGHGLKLGIIVCLCLGRRDIADGFEDTSVVEPVHPFEGCEFHRFSMAPRPAVMDDLGLEQAVDGFGEGVVIGVADAAD
jgi:hypothetical protein